MSRPVSPKIAAANAEALKTLTGARRLIKKGWTKGAFHISRRRFQPSGRTVFDNLFCSVGALRKVDGPGEKRAMMILGKVMAKMNGNPSRVYNTDSAWPEIITFNDAGTTSQDQVVAAFDQAIKMVSVD